jgi:hypothetical protein
VKALVKAWIFIAVVLAVGAAQATSATDKTRASLLMLEDNPLRVAGRGFVARERVRLRTTVNGRRLAKTVRATPQGRFSAQFQVDAECWPFVVYADGGSGSRATLRRIRIPPPCGALITP